MVKFWRRLLEGPSDNDCPYNLSQSRAYERIYTDQAGQLSKSVLYQFGVVRDHPCWTQLLWDPVGTADPLPLAEQSAEVFYCSHAIEKLTIDQNRHFFEGLRRSLKPGGVLRVASLDAQLCYEAYRRRDVFVNFHYGLNYPFGEPGADTFSKATMSIWLVNQIAGQLVQSVRQGHVPVFAGKHAELDSMFDLGSMEEVFDSLCAMIDAELQRADSNHHVSWWCFEKLSNELKTAGFSNVRPSVAGGSVIPQMRDSQYFDRDIPTLSFFAEAIA